MAKKTENQKKQSFDKYLPIPYEYAFVVLAFIFGLLFIYENPPFHSNDEDRHFLHAYHIAHNGPIPVLSTDSTKIGGMISENLVKVVKSFQGVPYHQGQKINRKSVEQLSKIELNSKVKKFNHDQQYRNFPLAYLPHSIGIAIAGESNPVSIGYAARIGGLVFFIIMMFLIIKITPIMKSVFFLYGLTPMVLYQCSSVSYDLFAITLAFLVLALFLKFSLDENAFLDIKMLGIVVLIVFIQQLSKNGYFFLPAIFLLIPKRKIKVNYILFLVVIGLLLILFFKNSTSMWGGLFSGITGDAKKLQAFQRDFKFNQTMRIEEVLSDIPHFISSYFANLVHFAAEWGSGIFGRFGYSYSTMSEGFYIFHGLILIAVAVLDSNKGLKLSNTSKYIVGMIGLLTMFGVVFGFYLSSPIGSNMIFGFQGRYFAPAIPFVLILCFNDQFKFAFWDKYGSLVLSGYVIVSLAYTLGEMKKLFYAF